MIGVIGAMIGYDRGFREYPQPDWVTTTPEMRFRYGSIGAEFDAGIPYWIFYVLPGSSRKFTQDGRSSPAATPPSACPGKWAGNPVGFTKKTIGFPGWPTTAPSAHTTTYRTSPDSNPVFVVGGPAHTTNVQGFFRLLIDCARIRASTPTS